MCVCVHLCSFACLSVFLFFVFSVSGSDCIFVGEGGLGQDLGMFSNNTESLQTNFCVKTFIIFIYYNMICFSWNDKYLRPWSSQVRQGVF